MLPAIIFLRYPYNQGHFIGQALLDVYKRQAYTYNEGRLSFSWDGKQRELTFENGLYAVNGRLYLSLNSLAKQLHLRSAVHGLALIHI